MLPERYTLMKSKQPSKPPIIEKLKTALKKSPGLTTKDLAERMDVNRQFMAGFLAALEERGDVVCRKAGPARIYFAQAPKGDVPPKARTSPAPRQSSPKS